MKPITWIGIVLAVLGALALAYQGISYTRQERVLDIGPIHATAEKHERIPIPPIVGGMALIGGAVLLVIGAKQKA
jgi:drug/metabolite transporter (DMT)-like permease